MGIHDDCDSDVGNYNPPPTKKLKSFELSPELSSYSEPSSSSCVYTLANISKRLEEVEKFHSREELVKVKDTINSMKKEILSASGKLEEIANNLKCLICKKLPFND